MRATGSIRKRASRLVKGHRIELRPFKPHARNHANTAAEIKGVHHVAGGHSFLEVIVRRIDTLRARDVERRQIAVDEVANRLIARVVPQLITTVIVVAVSEYVRELAQQHRAVRRKSDVVRVIKFVSVPESAAHFDGRLFRSDVITLGYRSSSLQVQLS